MQSAAIFPSKYLRGAIMRYIFGYFSAMAAFSLFQFVLWGTLLHYFFH